METSTSSSTTSAPFDPERKRYILLNRLALKAQRQGITAAIRSMRNDLRKRARNDGERFWIQKHLRELEQQARCNLLAHAWLYRGGLQGLVRTEDWSRTRKPLSIDAIRATLALITHYYHEDAPRFEDAPGTTYKAKQEAHGVAKEAYLARLGEHALGAERALMGAAEAYQNNHATWLQRESTRADTNATRRRNHKSGTSPR